MPTPQRQDERPHIPDDRGMRRNMGDWRPSRRALIAIGVAFAVGLALFLLLWWRDRGNDFYRPEAAPQSGTDQQFEPLPAPLPAGESAADNHLGEPTPQGSSPTATIETPPSPPAPAPRPAEAPSAPPVAEATMAAPVPISSPAPDYPPDAFRNRESGTVLLRVHVGPDGAPYSIDLVESSHSRALDRAAADAVRRWRFRPAQRGGQPVAGVVQVPIVFTADR
jgi:protein TonB